MSLRSGCEMVLGMDPVTGREALDRHLQARAEVRRVWTSAALMSWNDGGPDPLSEVVCLREDGLWRFVGYGLSELDEKTSDDGTLSGWGFETTLAVVSDEAEPPSWPQRLLRGLARHVLTTHDVLADGDQVWLPESEGNIAAFLFTADPLGAIATPFGRVRFVQAVGITRDELDAVRTWQSIPFLELLRDSRPALATVPDRCSILTDADVERTVRIGSRRDGSSTGEGRAEILAVRQRESGLELTLDARTARDLGRMLPARLPFGRPYRLRSGSTSLVFAPEGVGVPVADPSCVVELTARQVDVLGERLGAKRGQIQAPELSGLSIRVEPLEVRDERGSVVEIIG